MSNIFDALQRAESENGGAERPMFSLATDLLQAAEQNVRETAFNTHDTEIREPFDLRDPVVDLSASESIEDVDRCPVLPVSIQEDSHLVSIGKEESLGADKLRFLTARFRRLRPSPTFKTI